MKVCGIEMGDVAVIVGVNDDALWRATEAVEGKSYAAPSAAFGVGDGFVRIARAADLVLIARNLGDSMHPTKYRPMVDALRASGVPFVATTHSPYLLDCFSGDEVIVLHEGRAARLSQHPQWSKWATLCNAGEFWSAEGEAWVANVAAEGRE